MKVFVRDQLKLLFQKRYVISIFFILVEEQLYQLFYREMVEVCGFDEEGGFFFDEWSLENYVEEMRLWLNRLRQIVFYFEVGVQNWCVLGSNRIRFLWMVDEVFDVMLDQSDVIMKVDERVYLVSKLI